MDITEKINRLLEGRVKSSVAEAAGVSPSVLSKYINRGSMPPANIAFKLAKTLEVSLDWLLDDDRGFPPPEPGHGQFDIRDIPEIELIDELTRRYIQRHTSLLKEADALARIDWMPLAQAIYTALASREDPPADAIRLAERAFAFEIDCGQLRVEYDIVHKARLYDLTVRGLPFDQCKNYDPEEVEHAVAGLRQAPVFEYILNAPMLVDKPDIAEIKSVVGQLEGQPSFNILEFLADLEEEGRTIDQNEQLPDPPAKAAKLRPRNRGKGQAPRSTKKAID